MCLSSSIASNDISSKTTGWILTKLSRNGPYMALFKIVQMVQVYCISGSDRQKIDLFKMKTLKIFFSETTKPGALIFGMKHLPSLFI